MPAFTPSVPPLCPTPSSASSPAVLDDVKLQFVTEEVRRRFSAISMTDMLAVLSKLLTDSRICKCAEEQTGGAVKSDIHRFPLALQLKPSSASTHGGGKAISRLQQQASLSSSTANELNPRGKSTRNFEMNEVPMPNAPAASWLSQEWTTTVTSILENARQDRGPADAHCTVADKVQLSINEWFANASAETVKSEGMHAAADPAACESPAWLATLTQVRRLAEDTCRSKYEAVYQRLCAEAEDEGDEGMATPAYALRDDGSAVATSSLMARQSVHRTATGPVGIPPFSLAIQCGRDGSGTEVSTPPLSIDLDARNSDTCSSTSERNSASFVVGCEWFQWVFLLQSPLACGSEPYPEPEDGGDVQAVAAEQQRWLQRHCTVQLLYPSKAGFSDGSDGSSGLRSAEAEYDLSEPRVVLSSLLGVAMRVWCRRHPHIVAQVRRLEEDTHPWRVHDGTLFWSAWPLRCLGAQGGCGRAAAGGSMPVPLLPGECFAHEPDAEEDDSVVDLLPAAR
ncbi:hypothetical protein, conserved [Leishmania lindenbergi]|uniref:Uncharacterized protein n=1 Tax=Leishmania lindenbergi TaxID=651832 RepID=A0AAW3AZ74_9TRYP